MLGSTYVQLLVELVEQFLSFVFRSINIWFRCLLDFGNILHLLSVIIGKYMPRVRDTLTGIAASLAFSNNPFSPATASRALAGGTPISSAGATGLGSPGTAGIVLATTSGSVFDSLRKEGMALAPRSTGGLMNGAVIMNVVYLIGYSRVE
jgi:hypothetical protein